jgi:hypothetical protein
MVSVDLLSADSHWRSCLRFRVALKEDIGLRSNTRNDEWRITAGESETAEGRKSFHQEAMISGSRIAVSASLVDLVPIGGSCSMFELHTHERLTALVSERTDRRWRNTRGTLEVAWATG